MKVEIILAISHIPLKDLERVNKLFDILDKFFLPTELVIKSYQDGIVILLHLDKDESSVIKINDLSKAKISINKLLDLIIKQHQWSVNMRWLATNICCVRPIDCIAIFIDEKPISGNYEGIEFVDYKPNLGISTNDKINLLEDFIVGKNLVANNEEIKMLASVVAKPNPILVHFDSVYLNIPKKIIKQILFTECLAIYQPQLENVCLMVSSISKPDLQSFSRTLNSRLLDIQLMFQRDIALGVDEYKDKWHKKIDLIDGRKISLHTKVKEMCALADKLSTYVNLDKKYIELSWLDLCSEIVNEYPMLRGTITKVIYPYNLSLQQQASIALIENLYELKIRAKFLPKKGNDPFGLKNKADVVAKYILNNAIDIKKEEIFGDLDLQAIKNFVLERLQLHLQRLNPILAYTNCLDIITVPKIQYLTLNLNPNKIKRLRGLVKKIVYKPEVANYDDKLLKLKLAVENLTFENMESTVDDFINHIDENRVADDFRAVEVIKSFLDKINSYIDLEKFINNHQLIENANIFANMWFSKGEIATKDYMQVLALHNRIKLDQEIINLNWNNYQALNYDLSNLTGLARGKAERQVKANILQTLFGLKLKEFFFT